MLDENSRIDLPIRVAGLLVLLYGARISQIRSLTTADVAVTPQRTSIALAEHPIDLPEPVATLVERLAQQAADNPRAQTPDSDAHFLFPGARPHEPIHPRTLGLKLAEVEVPPRLSRNYAMVALTNDLPAAVVAAQLGLDASTTNLWAKFGQRDRAEYLLARRETRTTAEHSSRKDEVAVRNQTQAKVGAAR